MLKKIIQLTFAILFLPACFSFGLIFYEELSALNMLSGDYVYFFFGCISYLIFHTIIFKPDRVYVFGHEMMHAVAAILSGGKVGSIKVSKKGGSVTTNKSSTLISLAPYFFPFYTLLVIIIYFILLSIGKEGPAFTKPFMFIVGFTLIFHIVLTIDVLKIKQTDLLGTGYFVSLELIYLVNLVFITFIFSLLFKEINFMSFMENAFIRSRENYISIFHQLFL